LLNITINQPKLVDMCGYILATNRQNFSEIYLAQMKILQKVLGWLLFLIHTTFHQHNCQVYHRVKQWNFDSPWFKSEEKKETKWNEKKKVTWNSSGDEIANVKLFTKYIVHALQNTIDWCINTATDRRGYVLERRFTKFSETKQCNGHQQFSYQSKTHMQLTISD